MMKLFNVLKKATIQLTLRAGQGIFTDIDKYIKDNITECKIYNPDKRYSDLNYVLGFLVDKVE